MISLYLLNRNEVMILRKTTETNDNIPHKLTVSAETLAQMLNCGRATAVKIGTDAKARIQIGRRVLWNVNKVQQYLNTISGI